MVTSRAHRCTPGAPVDDPKCTWHPKHFWCDMCEGFYGVPHRPPATPTTHDGCCSMSQRWTPTKGCACRFCEMAKTFGPQAARDWREMRQERGKR